MPARSGSSTKTSVSPGALTTSSRQLGWDWSITRSECTSTPSRWLDMRSSSRSAPCWSRSCCQPLPWLRIRASAARAPLGSTCRRSSCSLTASSFRWLLPSRPGVCWTGCHSPGLPKGLRRSAPSSPGTRPSCCNGLVPLRCRSSIVNFINYWVYPHPPFPH